MWAIESKNQLHLSNIVWIWITDHHSKYRTIWRWDNFLPFETGLVQCSDPHCLCEYFWNVKQKTQLYCCLNFLAQLIQFWHFQTEESLKELSFLHFDLTQDDCETELEKYLNKFDRDQFDVIFCFSVSMWIHLNHGDQGLKTFFERMAKFGKSLVRLLL